ncbi:beta-galactosidase [Parasphingorhabdus halotolerans]|uniref:Beta-galactosidase n=1 Tax=Parasphingorhabdus halotolerans TaxID=2725558 RepID=A0A6H2DK65_9SPHN|nr:beta-galactosidase [Parasphingorhabdus halotolerans]QJB68734.1 beta-galactosidase [Parasphingorhabdus halotolerans]
MKLGCCYYPEHWPEDIWVDDARRMKDIGLSQVRIGEFAWSRIEPEPGRYDWAWLDRAIDTLDNVGLEIILGTPTATPPKWLVDSMPDMIAIDADGNPRNFGSRRHYCFSHLNYRKECERIVTALAERYGNHPAIVAWQTDNEYGCHDTIVSYSESAKLAFRKWLAEKYADVGALNIAWGNIFWSMEYRNFAEIDPPNLTVTEPNPSHVLDYRRFASDEVVSFNKLQVDILRARSPGRDMIHNYMGFFTEFNHHKVGQDLDVASWDSYPLGFLEQFWFSDEEKLRYARQGHPDIAAFHHDLYRGCCTGGRWSVMEQQPGPVNWARYNPAPLDGIVRLWTLEAMAHGAELVSYFRWRQAPFAQEQMHAGLLRPDNEEAQGAVEARQVAREIALLETANNGQKSVAIIFAYEAAWLFETQPQGQSFRYIELVFEMYSALRQLGLNVDIVSHEADLSGYKMIVAPSLPILSSAFVDKIKALAVPILFGPRTGSKTADFQIPAELPPGALQDVLPLKIKRVQSLRPGLTEKGDDHDVSRWIEDVETDLVPSETLVDERGILFGKNGVNYLAAWPSQKLLRRIFMKMASDADVGICELPRDLRLRSLGDLQFAFNHGIEALSLSDLNLASAATEFLIGEENLPSAGVAVWRRQIESQNRA